MFRGLRDRFLASCDTRLNLVEEARRPRRTRRPRIEWLEHRALCDGDTLINPNGPPPITYGGGA